MCRTLGVSPSGYYARSKRPPSERSRADAELTARMKTIHERSDGTYGAPRIHAELAEVGMSIGRKRVARLMRAAGLVGVSRRKWICTTVRDRDARPAPDLVERNFVAQGPNALWVADITYIPTWAGFLYLAVVLDAFSRRIVGWAMATHLRHRTGPRGAQLGALATAASQRDSSFRSRHPVHLDRLRTALPRGTSTSVNGLGRRLFRQCDVREFLRHP
jgi:transposase InsO family protein